MKIHVVGGFLGSGKTTAILGAAKHLTALGQRVGIVTNDQGKFLVDTSFFRQQNFPTGEVVGGCFCCNYHDLDARINDLHNSADVIFAETVGSCADLVATVIKPLQQFRQDVITFSVFTDVRLLRAWLREDVISLSDDIIYIFGKQIEEANLLILNKVDLISGDQLRETENLLQARFPGKRLRPQNSLKAADVAGWVAALSENIVLGESLTIDYDRYGAGEAQLAWLDEAITLTVPPPFADLADVAELAGLAGVKRPDVGREAVIRIIGEIVQDIQKQHLPVGHLKFYIQGETASCKISFTTTALDQPGWEHNVPALTGQSIHLLVNARVEAEAQHLKGIVRAAFERAQKGNTWTYVENGLDAFHPGFPKPVYRLI